MCIGPYGVTSHVSMSLTPSVRRWLRSVPLPSGRARFPVLSKSYCLGCSRNNSTWPFLCRAQSYCLPYRKDQEAYTGRWTGQLLWRFGRDPNLSVIRRDRLKGNVSVTYVILVPWRRERRRHILSPQLLYHRWAARSTAQLLSESMN